jgi:tRNA-specific 2-thiouridylase
MLDPCHSAGAFVYTGITKIFLMEVTGMKAIVLLSGGLDSVLAATLLERLGVEVTGMSFVTPFFNSAKAEKAASKLGIKLMVKDIGDEHLEMLKHPRYGYGRNMNPCIDCHGLMVRKAMGILPETGADFVATGEVLGERPKSQNRQALDTVASLSEAGDRLLRPLSARLLPATKPERDGLISKEDLLDLQGRSRKRQMKLVAEWGIDEYESPAGGCLLTDANVSARLSEMMSRQPEFDIHDALLVPLGRHVWSGDSIIVLGRRHDENENLHEVSLESDLLLREAGRPGPLALLRTYPRGRAADRAVLAEAARLLGIYGKGKRALSVDQVVATAGGVEEGSRFAPDQHD